MQQQLNKHAAVIGYMIRRFKLALDIASPQVVIVPSKSILVRRLQSSLMSKQSVNRTPWNDWMHSRCTYWKVRQLNIYLTSFIIIVRHAAMRHSVVCRWLLLAFFGDGSRRKDHAKYRSIFSDPLTKEMLLQHLYKLVETIYTGYLRQ